VSVPVCASVCVSLSRPCVCVCVCVCVSHTHTHSISLAFSRFHLFLLSPDHNNRAVVSLVFSSSFPSFFFSLYHSNLGAVVSFFGALLGSAVIYIIPGMMYRRAREAQLAASGSSEPLGLDYRIAGKLSQVRI